MTRFAIVGTNFITERFLNAAAFCPDFSLAAIYSRTEETARAFATKHGAPLTICDFEALATSPEIDAVYLASPNACHAQQAIRLLEAGKHVLCEKPMASNTAELEAMLAAATRGGAVLLEAMRPVFSPGLTAIRTVLPRLGAIRRVTFRFCQYSSRYDQFKAGTIGNTFNPTLSNSALMDIGVYCVHTLVALFGAPESILAHSVLLHNGFEGIGTILARYPHMLAELIYSKITSSHHASEIQGENGCLLIEKVSSPTELTFVPHSGERESIAVPQRPHDMRYELEAFFACIAQPQLTAPYHEYSRITARLIDEARRQTGIVFPADNPSKDGALL